MGTANDIKRFEDELEQLRARQSKLRQDASKDEAERLEEIKKIELKFDLDAAKRKREIEHIKQRIEQRTRDLERVRQQLEREEAKEREKSS